MNDDDSWEDDSTTSDCDIVSTVGGNSLPSNDSMPKKVRKLAKEKVVINNNKRSRGSCFVLQQSKATSYCGNKSKLLTPAVALKPQNIGKVLKQLQKCCINKCVLKLCEKNNTLSLDELLSLINESRNKLRFQTNIEKDRFLTQEFKQSIKETITQRNGKLKVIDHCFHITVKDKKEAVCRNGWAVVFGFSKYNLDMASKRIKAAPDTDHVKQTTFTEKTIQPYCYNDVEDIMMENVPDYGICLLLSFIL